LCTSLPANPQERLRIAILDFAGSDEKHSAETSLGSGFSADDRAVVVDPAQVATAVAAGYTSSLNLTLQEARQIGGTIGCDAFVLGKVFVERSETNGRVAFEVFVGLFLVDTRTGQLIRFQSVTQRDSSAIEAKEKALTAIKTQAKPMIDLAIAFRKKQSELPAATEDATAEELPEENTPAAKGFTPPQFFRRYTPTYTELAAHAEVTATVELNVVFRANATIGEISVTRWAGFGLDESAIETVRSIKFEAAKRDGRPVSVRAPVRYNFRSH
jgi:TonB family protein